MRRIEAFFRCKTEELGQSNANSDFQSSVKDPKQERFINESTVLALLKPRGSIFQNGFLGEVLFKFGPPGVVFKLGFYLLRTLRNAEALPIVEKR